MPPRKTEPVMTVIPPPLVEIPYFYLSEKSQWTDFKRSLNNCGLVWNIPDWMSTILYNGEDYQKVFQEMKEIETIFRPPTIVVGEEKVDIGDKSRKMLKILNISQISDSVQPSMKFCNLNKLEYEPDTKLPARQKFWMWMTKCLMGNKSNPGPYYYLTQQCIVYDIAHLYKRLVEVLETVTICSLDDEVYHVTHLEFDPTKEDLFGYLEELRRAIRRLNDLNEKLPVEGRVTFPDTYVRSRLIRAARQVPTYKPVIDNLITMPIKDWSIITVEQLYARLEAAKANDLSVAAKRSNFANLPISVSDDSVQANLATSKPKNSKETRTCHEFTRTGACKKSGCPYLHSISSTKPEQKNSQASSSQTSVQQQPKCTKCGEGHLKKDCKYSGKCTWCGKDNHKESCCHLKRNGKPKVLFSNVVNEHDDGFEIHANCLIVEDNTIMNLQAQEEIVKPPNTICEKFLADTGANRSVHPSVRAANQYYGQPMDINTAAGKKSLKSEGVGSMKLYTPKMELVGGFDRVIFCKSIAEKLASVGEMCDSGLVFVFDDKKLTTYKKDNCAIQGEIITCDYRDPKSRLYPITLFRKMDEENIKVKKVTVPASGMSQPTPTSSMAIIPILPSEILQLPQVIEDKPISTALLAKTYIKPGLSEIDRYHAKLGDVGIKWRVHI